MQTRHFPINEVLRNARRDLGSKWQSVEVDLSPNQTSELTDVHFFIGLKAARPFDEIGQPA
jgi:hypothetical protein